MFTRSRLRKALRLSPRDWLVLAEAWWTLLLVKSGLRFARSRVVERALSVQERNMKSDRLSRLVELFNIAAGHHVTEMNCLPRSISLQRMCLRRGIAPRLRIGVRRGGEEKLEGHAWLELDGAPLNDASDVGERFTVLETKRS